MLKKTIFILTNMVVVANLQAQQFKSEFSCGDITIDSIKRSSSETVLLRGTISNTSKDSCPIGGIGILQNDLTPKVVLQDLEGRREFAAATVSGRQVSSHHQFHLKAGETAKFWVRLTAPPKELKQVTVVLGGEAAPIENVPVQD